MWTSSRRHRGTNSRRIGARVIVTSRSVAVSVQGVGMLTSSRTCAQIESHLKISSSCDIFLLPSRIPRPVHYYHYASQAKAENDGAHPGNCLCGFSSLASPLGHYGINRAWNQAGRVAWVSLRGRSFGSLCQGHLGSASTLPTKASPASAALGRVLSGKLFLKNDSSFIRGEQLPPRAW